MLSASTPAGARSEVIQQLAMVQTEVSFGGLRRESLSVFGILVVSVILAMRKRARLVMGRRIPRDL